MTVIASGEKAGEIHINLASKGVPRDEWTSFEASAKSMAHVSSINIDCDGWAIITTNFGKTPSELLANLLYEVEGNLISIAMKKIPKLHSVT